MNEEPTEKTHSELVDEQSAILRTKKVGDQFDVPDAKTRDALLTASRVLRGAKVIKFGVTTRTNGDGTFLAIVIK